ncbi:MAG: GAF domain-containing protein, partial [Candidatus Thermoplasmatota archaeon]|nr:GAF domain-containing protein [Candidatus Thermoplasmatota archaeon]
MSGDKNTDNGTDRKEPVDQDGPPVPDPAMEIQRLKKELRLRSDLAMVVTSYRSPKELLPNILSTLCEGFGAKGGAIFFMDRETDEILLRSSYGLDPTYIIKYQKIHLGSHVTGKVAETGEGMIIKDAAMDNRSTKGVVEILRYRSAVVTPVTSEGEVVGIIALISEEPDVFCEEDLKKLEFIGAHISLAIVNSFLNQEIQQEKERTLDILERLDEGIFEAEITEPIDIDLDPETLALTFYQRARFNLLNPSFTRQSGNDVAVDDRIGKGFEEVQLFRLLKEALKKGEVKGIERKWIGEQERLMEISMVRVDKEDRIKGIKGVRRDVTRRLRMEEDTMEAKSKMEFHLDLLSHDISNINTSVLGFLDVIDKMLISPKDLHHYIALSKEEIARSSRLIRKIKTLSRIIKEKPSLGCSEISRKIQNSFDIVKKQYPERIIKLEDLGIRDEILVTCDELVDELFQNLFKIIVESLNGEEIEIAVEVKIWEYDNKNGYLFTFSDNSKNVVEETAPVGKEGPERTDLDLTWGLIKAIL